MATVFDVAKYVLKQLGSITTMKLQKLVYYCQAWSLGWDGKPLFADLPDYKFSKDELETLKAVLDYYGDKDPQWLSELTHKEAPWKEARVGVPVGTSCSNIISKESMQQYYGGLQ